ncbi:MAG: HEAT repeat domain-containing protein [bacterium]|nr:HEAT repeat domain-containing protein [bacterium]
MTCDQLIHSYLNLPRFELSNYLPITYTILLLLLLFKPAYTNFIILLFLIPWLYIFSYCWVFLESSLAYLFLCCLLIVLIFFCYYIKKSFIDSRKELLKGLDSLRQGNTYESCGISFFDERGKVLRNLNQWASLIRERSRRMQFISPEIWHELKNTGVREERTSKDRWVISLVISWGDENTSGSFDRILLDWIGFVCDQLNASINCFHSGYAELIVMEENKKQGNDVLLLLSEFKLQSKRSDQFIKLVVRRNFMKTGVVLEPEGYRFRCVDFSLVEDLKFLRGQSKQLTQIYIHESLRQSAEQVFHLQESMADYFLVQSVKNQDYHLQNLLSHQVEDRLNSIRVVEAQRNITGVDTLIKLLGDVSPRVRIAAAGALTKFVNKENENHIGQSLLNCLEKEWNQDMRATLVMSLGKLRSESLIKPLYKLLSDQNDRVRANAVEAIGQCMDRKTVLRYLDGLLDDSNNRARANAAMAVWLMGDRKGFSVLLGMARSTDSLISSSGLYGIGEIFTDENIKINSKFVSNPIRYYFKEKSLFDDALKVCIDKTLSDDVLVERNAIIALGKFRSKKSVNALEFKFSITKEPSLRNLILNTLLNLEEFELVTTLRK